MLMHRIKIETLHTFTHDIFAYILWAEINKEWQKSE